MAWRAKKLAGQASGRLKYIAPALQCRLIIGPFVEPVVVETARYVSRAAYAAQESGTGPQREEAWQKQRRHDDE